MCETMLTRRIDAPSNCDSVEVNPSSNTIFIGMYEYEESSSSRGGGFLILDAKGDEKSRIVSDYGCLDAKWLSDDLITIACSDGLIRNYSKSLDKIVQEIPIVSKPSSSDTSNIIMTIDSVNGITAIITANGRLALTRDAVVTRQWEAHSPVLESWCCGLNPDASVVVTGSDDCSLKFWDTTSQDLLHHDKRNHRMGTTCIEFLDNNMLLSGSYDDCIRLFDMRNLAEPVNGVKSIGGIWRLKPFYNRLLVAACYGGCQILELDTLEPIVAEYTGHDSIAYGIGALDLNRAVSCSFYDKSIQFWEFQD